MGPDSCIASWTTSIHDDKCTITVPSLGAVFYLEWAPSSLETAPMLLADYHRLLKISKDDENGDKNEDEDHFESQHLAAEKFGRTL
ncbi:uncharacterized protein PgNI_02959 [Pyricularia grisea]|uniref:Uncharacterized protein n=1 Tax=Pyricularia grisea TaxID=148305 RepID=A0A6P8BDI8_PYRGI|nr:uncharacterized protein PgNI_02959 [Pyricularia grisea]TLD13941.1 hypothetical protein PgNI_02959 [Pyricularia grisea]